MLFQVPVARAEPSTISSSFVTTFRPKFNTAALTPVAADVTPAPGISAAAGSRTFLNFPDKGQIARSGTNSPIEDNNIEEDNKNNDSVPNLLRNKNRRRMKLRRKPSSATADSSERPVSRLAGLATTASPLVDSLKIDFIPTPPTSGMIILLSL